VPPFGAHDERAEATAPGDEPSFGRKLTEWPAAGSHGRKRRLELPDAVYVP
jgi:hypothetical protein